ncbi:MAG: glycosyltransferase family 39 protein, partial [bacterium]
MEKNKEKVNKAFAGILNWIKKNPVEFWILLVILSVGAFLRLYKIDQYMTFLGDEGRDVIIVRRLLVNFDPILIGPGTSIGNMYLGPLYYYLIAPALFLAGYSPVGPAVLVAVLAVATIWLIWRVGREWFGKFAGLIAAGLYAISPTVIIYSRSSWNPNIMPFFALLSIYSVWKVWSPSAKATEGQASFRWLLVLGISYAFVLQSHYLGLLLAPTLFLFWILTFRNLKLFRNSTTKSVSLLEIRNFLQKSLIGFLIFAGLMSPLVIFDARHGWRNYEAMKQFITVRQETVSIRPWKAIPNMWPIFEKANTRLLTARNEIVGKTVSLILLFLIGWIIAGWKKIDHRLRIAYGILFIWLAFALIGLGLYKQEIYDHYYGFFFPAPFLLLGVTVSLIYGVTNSRVVKTLLVMGLGVLVYVNILNSPVRFPPNMQLQRSKAVAEKIAIESGGKRFNLAVVAERNYEDGYQYFLEKEGRPVVDIDAQVPDTITDRLFVVCEMPKEKCDPTHSPKAEVANFGWTKIENEWEVYGVT